MSRRAGSPTPQLSAEAGVTLVEIMVAVTLLSFLSLGMVLAIRGGLSAYQRTETKLMDNRRVVGAQRILQQELEGMMPVFAMCGAGSGGPGTKAVAFQGLPESLTMVSTFSLAQGWRGQPQILQIFQMPGGESGGVRLAVNEIPFNGSLAAGSMCTDTFTPPNSISKLALFARPAASPKSFVLADKLESCRFSYYSPGSAVGDPPSWQPSWAVKGWPLAVRIEMAPLSADPSHLQPITVTAPIHLRRDPEKDYAAPKW